MLVFASTVAFTMLVSECTLAYSRLQYWSVSVQSRTVGYSADQWLYSGVQYVTVLVSECTLAYIRLQYWLVPVQWRTVGYSASQLLYSGLWGVTLLISAMYRGVQWVTMLVSACLLAYSWVQCWKKEMHSRVQWDTVNVSKKYSKVQKIQSSCQTMSVEFWEYKWVLNSVVTVGCIN